MKYLKLLLGFIVVPGLLLVLASQSYNYLQTHKPVKPPPDIQTYTTTCGGTQFTVSWIREDNLLTNSFVVTAPKDGKDKVLWSTTGGPFHAACLIKATDKKPVLLVQDYCNASRCVDGWYIGFDPHTLKVILDPPYSNFHNITEASKFLGYRVPHLAEYKDSFCCKDRLPTVPVKNMY